MTFGHQPPVESPLPAAAFAAALASMVSSAARGRAATRIEEQLRARFGSRVLRLTGSGTIALALALQVARQTTGRRRVALPAYGCYDLATACDAAGLEPVLYDLDPGTLGPATASLDAALDREVAAVVAVHLYGVPVDLAMMAARARAAGALLIEDAAQGVGGSYAGRPLGATGDLGVLSFGRGKGLTAGGGGALLCRDPALGPAVARLAADTGGSGFRPVLVTLAQWILGRPGLYWIPANLPMLGLGETHYRAPEPARGLSAGGLGLLGGALALEAGASERRRRIAGELAARLAACEGIRLPAPAPGAVPGYLRFPVVAAPERAAALQGMAARSAGVAPGYPMSLADLPGFAERVANRGLAVPGSRELAGSLFTLPTHRWARPDRLAELLTPSMG